MTDTVADPKGVIISELAYYFYVRAVLHSGSTYCMGKVEREYLSRSPEEKADLLDMTKFSDEIDISEIPVKELNDHSRIFDEWLERNGGLSNVQALQTDTCFRSAEGVNPLCEIYTHAGCKHFQPHHAVEVPVYSGMRWYVLVVGIENTYSFPAHNKEQ